jgi:hypothetical protein
MSLPRCVEPEWLDQLTENDVHAVGSRRDLRRINGWMLQSAIMARLLRRHCGVSPPRRIVDIGTGDGTFMLRVARRLAPHWPAVSLLLLDRRDVISRETRAGFAAIGWTVDTMVADAFEGLARHNGNADLVTANLFLHHFPADELARLLALAAGTAPVVAACEPRRGVVPLLASRLSWAIGANRVTRHDAPASVRAGFAGRELSALWPYHGWDLDERESGPFTHCFAARRRDIPAP